MSKKDEEIKNLTQEIKGMKENKYYQKEIMEIKELLKRALSGAGRARR